MNPLYNVEAQDGWTVLVMDLHSLTEEEVLRILKLVFSGNIASDPFLAELLNLTDAVDLTRIRVWLVTGVGKHSTRRKAVLRTCVHAFARKEHELKPSWFSWMSTWWHGACLIQQNASKRIHKAERICGEPGLTVQDVVSFAYWCCERFFPNFRIPIKPDNWEMEQQPQVPDEEYVPVGTKRSRLADSTPGSRKSRRSFRETRA